MDGAIFDVTERKEAEEALLESEETFRGITSAAQSAIIMVSHEGTITFWNQAAEKIFGYTEEEVIGKNMHRILAPERYLETAETAYNIYSKTGEGERIGKTTELTGKRKDGTEFPFEIALSSIRLKSKWNAIGIINDITQRKQAEEELKDHMKDLERFSRLTINREEKMIQLKEEINALLNQTGNKKKYKIVD